ncbi:unnamed protein product, partial [Polarella glacialis]
AEKLISSSVQGRCKGLFAQEHLAAITELLAGNSVPSSTPPPSAADVREALAALGQNLESSADRFDEALEDFFLDAAGALRSAARLFAPPAPPRKTPPPPASSDARAVSSSSSPPQSIQDIERAVISALPAERRAILRELARQYHPDRNPGREMEVLPAFLYVQRLREEWSRWGR